MSNYKVLFLFQDSDTNQMLKITRFSDTPIQTLRDTVKEYTESGYKFIQFFVLHTSY